MSRLFHYPTSAVFEHVDKLLISLTYRLMSLIVIDLSFLLTLSFKHVIGLISSSAARDHLPEQFCSPTGLIEMQGKPNTVGFSNRRLTEVLVLKSQPPANTRIF